MKKIKYILVLVIALCTLTLIVSSCHKEKITKWRCVPYEGCNIELTFDNEADLVYVSADYSGFISPDPTLDYHFLFHNNTTYKKIGNTLRYIDPYFNVIDSTGFAIISQTDAEMDLVADKYGHDCYYASFYITDYHFVRVD